MPFSFRGILKSDGDNKSTYSQSAATNLAGSDAGMTVGNILADRQGDFDIFAASPNDTVAEVASGLKEKRIGVMLVLDEHKKLIGILSERDIVRKLADEGAEALKLRASEVMTPDPITCSPDEKLIAMLKRMTENRFRHLPVMDGENLVGIISLGDVVKYRLQELEYEALRMRQMIVG